MTVYNSDSNYTDLSNDANSLIEEAYQSYVSSSETENTDVIAAIFTNAEVERKTIITFSSTATLNVTITGPDMNTVLNSVLESTGNEILTESEFDIMIIEEINHCEKFTTESISIPMQYINGQWYLDYTQNEVINALSCGLLYSGEALLEEYNGALCYDIDNIVDNIAG